MPLINLRSTLSEFGEFLKTESATYVKAREDDRERLLKFLNSPQGTLFAAKQTALSPGTAPQRLAGLLAQITVGQPGVHIRTVFNENPNSPLNFNLRNNVPKFRNLEKEIRPDSIQQKYYVKSPVDKQWRIEADHRELRELDIVPFYFSVLDTSSGEVTTKYHLAFRSFFSSITDSTTGGYSSYNFIGRGENFHTYQNYTRTTSFSFKVAAFTREELNILHAKVENLRKLAAPKYRNGYMQGNYINLTIGSYFRNMPGFVTSVNVSIAENYNWEIEDRTFIMPHVMDITVAYTVLENETPQLDKESLDIPAKEVSLGATELAPVFPPSGQTQTPPPPAPQNRTADFTNRQSFGGVPLSEIFGDYA